MEGGAVRQNLPEAGKGKEAASPLKPPRGASSAHTLTSAQRDPRLTCDIQNRETALNQARVDVEFTSLLFRAFPAKTFSGLS